MAHRYHYVAWFAGDIVGQFASDDPNISDLDARCKILWNHQAVPLCDRPNESPSERGVKIVWSRIQKYDTHAHVVNP